MNNSHTVYENLSIIFSESRLSTYIKATSQDRLKALDLYKLNLQLSKALYPLLCVVEIALRNRIVNVLVKYCGTNWFDENEKLWLNGKMSIYKSGTDKLWEITQIEKAKKDITKRKVLITSDTITAELNLGFWVTILDGVYDRVLWNYYIEEVFVNIPKSLNISRNKKQLRQELHDIKKLRNRVFHHEPIFCTKTLTFRELLCTYQNILKIIGFLSEDADNFIKENNEFDNLIKLIPLNMKNTKKIPTTSAPKLCRKIINAKK